MLPSHAKIGLISETSPVSELPVLGEGVASYAAKVPEHVDGAAVLRLPSDPGHVISDITRGVTTPHLQRGLPFKPGSSGHSSDLRLKERVRKTCC